MKQKPISRLLRWVARHSPAKFATTIRRRNEALLKRLMLLQPYVGVGAVLIPARILLRVLKLVRIGCPHCQIAESCDVCVWGVAHSLSLGPDTPVFSRSACMYVPFGTTYSTLASVSDAVNHVRVNYLVWSAWLTVDTLNLSDVIEITNRNPAWPGVTVNIPAVEWQNCVDFVKAHIEWAQLPIWGSRLRRKR